MSVTPNYEKQFVRALEEALGGQQIETESGFTQTLGPGNVFRVNLPRVTTDTFNLTIEPEGPGFPIEALGSGGGMNARSVAVGITLTLYYEHPDQEVMVDVLLDAAWWLADFIIARRTLGGATRVIVEQGDYAWAKIDPDKDDDNIIDSTNLGVFVLPIVAEYRRA
ncbi:hypothetical protein [Deinococcus kurensis]|uniref:hypothetical protein n=1 Tax=Deinococcus kurensis TaxID=2662757 RepID=UPI0012D35DE5|nr:hypothetical protein [Deinococcus kurensis]